MIHYRQLLFIIIIFIPAIITAQTLEPTETNALLNVIVSSLDDKPRTGELITLTGQANKKTFSGITDAKGKFSVLIPEGDTYTVKYKIFGGEEKFKQVTIPSQEGSLTFQLDIKYDPPKVFTLENVFFDTGKSTLRAESFKTLNDLAEVMKLKPTLIIEIAGHTDNVGTPESNLKLSLNRANSVKNYLVNHGIATERISTKGYGDTQPVASNDSDDGRQKNRRTVVHILKE
ncbi:MAG TPA: OmpA family protein [Bacteroidales bacterium]|jgi:outer membrane protein OmpA-like peptidoglycan-associated protein|nr:OmpA family protein [Bacteroidales bacterium]HNZ42067.1 OmpA family protein [Bacteroidales bacterium]HOH82999.1 OmpA family protein [Bacteroidales bacterium]